MTNAASQYRKMLKKEIRCGFTLKEKLLKKFDQSLFAYAIEYDNATLDDLYLAFGPPKEMAEILISNVDEAEKKKYRRFIIAKCIFAGILASLLFVFTAYIFFFKEYGQITHIDEGFIHETYDVIEEDTKNEKNS